MSDSFLWRGDEVTAAIERLLSARLPAALEHAAERVRAACPVASGELRDSVTVEIAPDGLSGAVVVTSPHAAPVLFGHRTHSGTFVGPNPFVQRGMIGAASEVNRTLQDL